MDLPGTSGESKYSDPDYGTLGGEKDMTELEAFLQQDGVAEIKLLPVVRSKPVSTPQGGSSKPVLTTFARDNPAWGAAANDDDPSRPYYTPPEPPANPAATLLNGLLINQIGSTTSAASLLGSPPRQHRWKDKRTRISASAKTERNVVGTKKAEEVEGYVGRQPVDDILAFIDGKGKKGSDNGVARDSKKKRKRKEQASKLSGASDDDQNEDVLGKSGTALDATRGETVSEGLEKNNQVTNKKNIDEDDVKNKAIESGSTIAAVEEPQLVRDEEKPEAEKPATQPEVLPKIVDRELTASPFKTDFYSVAPLAENAAVIPVSPAEEEDFKVVTNKRKKHPKPEEIKREQARPEQSTTRPFANGLVWSAISPRRDQEPGRRPVNAPPSRPPGQRGPPPLGTSRNVARRDSLESKPMKTHEPPPQRVNEAPRRPSIVLTPCGGSKPVEKSTSGAQPLRTQPPPRVLEVTSRPPPTVTSVGVNNVEKQNQNQPPQKIPSCMSAPGGIVEQKKPEEVPKTVIRDTKEQTEEQNGKRQRVISLTAADFPPLVVQNEEPKPQVIEQVENENKEKVDEVNGKRPPLLPTPQPWELLFFYPRGIEDVSEMLRRWRTPGCRRRWKLQMVKIGSWPPAQLLQVVAEANDTVVRRLPTKKISRASQTDPKEYPPLLEGIDEEEEEMLQPGEQFLAAMALNCMDVEFCDAAMGTDDYFPDDFNGAQGVENFAVDKNGNYQGAMNGLEKKNDVMGINGHHSANVNEINGGGYYGQHAVNGAHGLNKPAMGFNGYDHRARNSHQVNQAMGINRFHNGTTNGFVNRPIPAMVVPPPVVVVGRCGAALDAAFRNKDPGFNYLESCNFLMNSWRRCEQTYLAEQFMPEEERSIRVWDEGMA